MRHPKHRTHSSRSRVGGFVLTSALLAAPLLAHGGMYRGPGNTTPPGAGSTANSGPSGGSGPSAGPSSSGSSTPGGAVGGSGGAVGGPSAGSARSGGRAPRGISLGEDYSQWQFWWEFNKEPLLDRRRALAGRSEADGVLGRALASSKAVQPPSRRDLQRTVIPALRATLVAPSSGPDIVSSCMVALARIGDAVADDELAGTSARLDLVATLRPFLESSKHQEKRETAALALGISGSPRAVPVLVELARGKLGEHAVDVRTRSFALYGLAALIARNPEAIREPASLQEAMRRIANNSALRVDVRVAALHVMPALAALPEVGKHLARPSIACCETLTKSRDQRLAAHAVIALGRTLGARPATEHVATRRMLIAKLADRELGRQALRSAAIAVGTIAREDPELRRDASRALQNVVRSARDTQARRFALMALSRLGGEANESFLRKRLLSDKLQDADRVWSALALGILGHGLDESKDAQRLARLASDLRRAFDKTKQALPASGIALALGLVHAKDSGDAILERMLAERRKQEPAGYFALALGLLRHESSRDEIRELVLGATRQELLLTQGAIALGLLGDPEIVDRLSTRLAASGSIAAKSSLARALGFLGDRRSLRPLVDLMTDTQRPDLPRAFAAVALGLASDTETLPWNARFAVDCNYRALLGTLVGGTAGILDIL